MDFYRACLKTSKSYWQRGVSAVRSAIHSLPIIYVLLLSQTTDGSDNNLDKKVDDCRRKLFGCPSWLLDTWCHSLLLSTRLRDLSNALYDRFEQHGGIEYLGEAITHYRQLERFNRYPIGDHNRLTTLSNLAIAVQTRFNQLGNLDDLEEAITCYRQALALRSHGHPNHSDSLNNLADALSTRFEQLGGIEDLEEAITFYRQALDLRPHGHPNRSDSLNNLAWEVLTRFEQLGGMERNNCFSISDVYSAGVIQRGWISRLPSLAQTSVGPFIRCGGFSLHPSAKNLLKVDIYILHSYLNLLL